MDGFVGGGIPTATEMWAGLGNDGGGTGHARKSASVVSRTYPDMYEPSNVPNLVAAGFSHLPGVVIDATAAKEHFSCCYPFDGGTMWYDCPNWDSVCRPGCFQTSGAWRGREPAWYYEIKFDGNQLASCLREMRNSGQCPSSAMMGGGWCAVKYNEIILREADYQQMVRAVFVTSDASGRAVALARAVRDEAAANGVHVPMLRYDRRLGFSA